MTGGEKVSYPQMTQMELFICGHLRHLWKNRTMLSTATTVDCRSVAVNRAPIGSVHRQRRWRKIVRSRGEVANGSGRPARRDRSRRLSGRGPLLKAREPISPPLAIRFGVCITPFAVKSGGPTPLAPSMRTSFRVVGRPPRVTKSRWGGCLAIQSRRSARS